MKSTLNTSDN